MKKSFFYLPLLALMLMASNLISQEVKWGKLNESKYKWFTPKLIADDEENIYSYYFESKKLHLKGFDRVKFKSLYDTEVPKIKVESEVIDYEKITVLKDDFVILGSYYKKTKNGKEKTRKYHIVALKANKKTGKLDKKTTKLFDVEVDTKGRRGDFDVYVSKDKSKFLVVHTAYYRKKKQTIANFKLYNADLELIEEFSEDFKKGDEDNKIDRITNLLMDNEGSIYYLVGLNKFVSLDATKGYEKWEEKIDIEQAKPGSSISSLRYVFDKEGNIKLFGFYSEDKKGLQGVFNLKLDYLTKEIASTKISELDKKFLDNLKSKRQKRREAKGKDINVRNIFNLIDLHPQDNGDLAVVAESFDYYYMSNDNGWMEMYSYGDVSVLNLDDEGNLKWAEFMPKKQLFRQGGNGWLVTGTFKGGVRLLIPVNPYKYTKYFSTISGVKDGKVVVMYNNHHKNTPTTPAKKLKAMKFVKKAKVEARIFDLATGKFEVKQVKNGAQKDAQFAPTIYYKTSDGKSIIVFAQKGKAYKLGELMLK